MCIPTLRNVSLAAKFLTLLCIRSLDLMARNAWSVGEDLPAEIVGMSNVNLCTERFLLSDSNVVNNTAVPSLSI